MKSLQLWKRSRKKFEYIVREYYYFGLKTNAGTYFDFKSDFDTQTKVKNKNRFQWLNIINISQSELGIFIMFGCQNLFLFLTFVCVLKSDLKLKYVPAFVLWPK